MKKNSNSTRRNFLKLGLAAGATALIGGGGKVLSAVSNPDAVSKETGEKVKLLSPDGSLV